MRTGRLRTLSLNFLFLLFGGSVIAPSIPPFESPAFAAPAYAAERYAPGQANTKVEQRLRISADKIQQEFNRIFATELSRDIPLQVLQEREFFVRLALPEHSIAVYTEGEITLGIPEGEPLDLRALDRTLRHEFVHAYVDHLSNGRAPAWFDEGLAQLLEGRMNDSREMRLFLWLASGQPLIQLDLLVDNLHLLDPELVPIAYGEALVAVRSLVNRKGFSAVRNYLSKLGAGIGPEEAFADAFGEGLPQFEKRLGEQLAQYHPARLTD